MYVCIYIYKYVFVPVRSQTNRLRRDLPMLAAVSTCLISNPPIYHIYIYIYKIHIAGEMYTHIHIHTYTCVYIYIERER